MHSQQYYNKDTLISAWLSSEGNTSVWQYGCRSLLQTNESDRLVDRIETDTLTRISDELQQVGGVKLNISAIARRVLCSCTTKIKCAVHWIQDLTHLK